MSTLLGKRADGSPVLNINSNYRTKQQLEDTGAEAGTIFHSDLPYVLVNKEFVLDTYTTYGGGRKFEIPQDLQDYRQANQSLTYLVILEDESGATSIHSPVPTILGAYTYAGSFGTFEISTALNGDTYQVVYTDSDTQLAYLTRNEFWPNLAVVFRTWDLNDTAITVFKTPIRSGVDGTSNGDVFGNYHPQPTYSLQESDMFYYQVYTVANPRRGDLLRSKGNDIAKVKIIFLNIEETLSGYNVQKDYTRTGNVKLSRQEFTIGDLNINEKRFLLSHGTKTSGTTISPLSGGDLYAGRRPYIGPDVSVIDSTNTLTGGDAPVIEITPSVNTPVNWSFDLANDVVVRNAGDLVIDSNFAESNLFYQGTKTTLVDLSMDTANTSIEVLPSTTSGVFGNIDSNTVFLITTINDNQYLHSTYLVGIGESRLFYSSAAYRDTTGPGAYNALIQAIFTIEITIYGDIIIRRRKYGYGNFGLTLNQFEIRVAAIGPN